MQSATLTRTQSPRTQAVIDVAQALEFRLAMKDIELIIRQALDVRLEGRGVTAAQGAALDALRRHPGMNLADVAAVLRLDAASLSRLVGRLEDKGLCLRFRPRGDRRSVRVELLAPGIALADDFPGIVADVTGQVLAGFGADERTTLVRHLGRILSIGETLD